MRAHLVILKVHIFADDIIVAAEDEKKHDAIMPALLSRTRDGVRFNREKIQFKVNPFLQKIDMGHFLQKKD